MNIVTHFLMGWTVAEHTVIKRRDKALVAFASVVPDLDGLGVVVDAASGTMGEPGGWYERFHRVLGHGLPAALVCTLVFAVLANERTRVAIWSLVTFHLHLACDMVGSRGPNVDDLWPVHYLSPLSQEPSLVWSGQWPLASWQNTTITIVLLAYAFVHAVKRGSSPVGIFSESADAKVVATLRARFARK